MRPLTFALVAAALAGAATVADAGGIDHRAYDVPQGHVESADAVASLLALDIGPPAHEIAGRAAYDPTGLFLGPGTDLTLANHKHRKVRKKKQHRWVPGHCIRKAGGHRRVVAKRCVTRNYPHLRLPRHCLREVWLRGHWRYAYGLRCLRAKGYHIH